MSERRVGRRGEQKRRWDRDARRPCVTGCGRVTWHGRLRCQRCDTEHRRMLQVIRELEIERLWLAGGSLRSIAAAFGTTVGAVNVYVVRMRRTGYDVPYRYRGYG